MKKEIENEYRGFTLGLAVFDMIPVLLFGISSFVIAKAFGSPLFFVGVCLIVLAGAAKVLWKFIIAIHKKNVILLNHQMRYIMPCGFILAIIAVLLDGKKIDFEALRRFIAVPYILVPLILTAICMGLMVFFAVKLDSKSAGNNKLEQSVNTAAQLFFLLAVIQLCYFMDFYRAENIEAYMKSSSEVTVKETVNGWLFDGPGEKEAMIFYPGAKVEAVAYAPILRELAENGVDCFLIEMPCNFAIYGNSKADDILKNYTYEKWYMSGHSLGGAMAWSYTSKHLDSFDGIVLLGAYAVNDFSDKNIKSLVIYGSEDKVLSKQKLAEGRDCYPENSKEICIEGGNHAYFGSYGEQAGDGSATIMAPEQQKRTVREILNFIIF